MKDALPILIFALIAILLIAAGIQFGSFGLFIVAAILLIVCAVIFGLSKEK
jgi:hypothetical protein